MCSSAFCTVLPCGSRTAFFGVIMIFAFINKPIDRPESFRGGNVGQRTGVMLGNFAGEQSIGSSSDATIHAGEPRKLSGRRGGEIRETALFVNAPMRIFAANGRGALIGRIAIGVSRARG